ncbi:hypothetical protein AGLY_006004 [Aphis glycines]|uniref:Uncharacterized protein n=1 Tax=Aphis glycines TaxID=307491 RepID=A0A6G0TUU1_APHGL|nr:hypothetical protein AGLY_006004 [Aphis glycines]
MVDLMYPIDQGRADVDFIIIGFEWYCSSIFKPYFRTEILSSILLHFKSLFPNDVPKTNFTKQPFLTKLSDRIVGLMTSSPFFINEFFSELFVDHFYKIYINILCNIYILLKLANNYPKTPANGYPPLLQIAEHLLGILVLRSSNLILFNVFSCITKQPKRRPSTLKSLKILPFSNHHHRID